MEWGPAVALFLFFTRAKQGQGRPREERFSKLKLRAVTGEGRPFALSGLHDTVRLVIMAGHGEFVAESFHWIRPPPRGRAPP